MPNRSDEVVDISRTFLDAVRRDRATSEYRRRLAELPEETLVALDDMASKAFWLNLYNAAAQDALWADPERWASKRRFFGGDRVTVAGQTLSLDDIEHGILRGSRSKYGLGYLPRLFPDDFEVRHRFPTTDPRIHFALNCGAASCPAISPYSASDVDRELDADTRVFLEQSSERESGELYVSRLLLYYRGDFGGRAGIFRFLEQHDIIESRERPRIRYKPYDWSLAIARFRSRNGD